jgi:hypothetical protein
MWCDTRIVEASNAPIATKHQNEAANLVVGSTVPTESPAGRHEATTVTTAEAGKGLPHKEELA